MWIAPVIATADGDPVGGIGSGRAGGRRADPPAVVRLARHRLVDQPAARRAAKRGSRPSRRSSCASSRAGPGRSSRPSSARTTTGCRRTTCRSIRSPSSRTARRRRTWASRCSRISPPTTSATSRPGNSSRARRTRWARWRRWSGTRATSTTGTTRSRCKPLPPLYVSSVDSGNLAGHLLTLRPGLAALADDRILDAALVRRPERHAARARRRHRRQPLRRRSSRLQRDLETAYDSRPATHRGGAASGSIGSARASPRSRRRSRKLPGADAAATPRRTSEAAFWADALVRQCRSLQDELAFLAPWSALPAAPDGSATCRASAASRRCASLPRSKRNCSPAIEQRRRADAAPAERAAQDERFRRRHRSESSRRAADGGDRAPRAAMRCARADGLRLSLRPARATCSPSATTSASAGATRATTTCSPPKRGSRASSRSRRDSCRRRTGSRSGACSRRAGGKRVLLSWSGSMFEYLMPLLVMPTYDNTLLDQTCSRGGRAPDRVREAARRAVGHLGMRLQHGRREPQLPVPRVRRAGSGVEARARRGPRRRALCVGAGADGRARGGVPRTCSGSPPTGSREDSACTRRSTTRPRGCRAGSRAPSCARSWRITRA